MVRSVDRNPSESVKIQALPPVQESEKMHMTIHRVKGLVLDFRAGSHSFEIKTLGPRLDELFHRKLG